MRRYQHIGLTTEAESFLHENVRMIPGIVCPDCKKVITTVADKKMYHHEDLFYGDGPDLHEYGLKDGRIVKEVVQCFPWSSGPMGFLCLEIDGKKMFEWSEEEIRKY